LPLIFVIILLLIAGNNESNAETSPITSSRNTNYYDNKLKKNPLIYIYNNKMMFSTSTPFFNSDNSFRGARRILNQIQTPMVITPMVITPMMKKKDIFGKIA